MHSQELTKPTLCFPEEPDTCDKEQDRKYHKGDKNTNLGDLTVEQCIPVDLQHIICGIPGYNPLETSRDQVDRIGNRGCPEPDQKDCPKHLRNIPEKDSPAGEEKCEREREHHLQENSKRQQENKDRRHTFQDYKKRKENAKTDEKVHEFRQCHIDGENFTGEGNFLDVVLIIDDRTSRPHNRILKRRPRQEPRSKVQGKVPDIGITGEMDL